MICNAETAPPMSKCTHTRTSDDDERPFLPRQFAFHILLVHNSYVLRVIHDFMIALSAVIITFNHACTDMYGCYNAVYRSDISIYA